MRVLREQRLVIFGCGYVGGELARRASAAGARVTALTRNPTRAAELRAGGVMAVVADLAADEWHSAIEAAPEAVVNCVSAAAFTPEGYRRSYVDGMRSILQWAARGPGPVGTFVYTSSTGVYPQGGGATVDESSPTDEAGATGRVLVEAEAILRAAPSEHVGRSFVLRLAGIYGPGRHSLLDQMRAGVETIPGRSEHHLNLIHRDDIVAAILACLAAGPGVRGGVFNLSDGQPATRSEVITWLAQRLGRPVPRFDPDNPGSRRGGAGVPDRIIANAAACRALGWRPRYPSFREGYEALLGPGEL